MKTILLLLLTFSVSIFAEDTTITQENQEIQKLKAEIAAMKKEKKVLDEIKALREEVRTLKKIKDKKRDNRLGIGVNLAGATILEGPISLSLDYFMNKHVDFEITLALAPIQTGEQRLLVESDPQRYETSLGLSLGFNYHLEINKTISYYFGLHGVIGYTPKSGDLFALFETDGKHILGYAPLGLQYMNQNGFTIAVELGLLTGILFDHIEYDEKSEKNIEVDKSILIGMPSIKLGYHF